MVAITRSTAMLRNAAVPACPPAGCRACAITSCLHYREEARLPRASFRTNVPYRHYGVSPRGCQAIGGACRVHPCAVFDPDGGEAIPMAAGLSVAGAPF